MAKKLVSTKVENDVKKIDDIKEEVINYAKERVETEVQNSFKRIEKKVVRTKNWKIFRRDLLIIILIALSCFLGYKLYKTGYFEKYFYIGNVKNLDKENDENVTNNEEGLEKEPEKEPEKDLSFHKVALDNINISIDSDYLEDYYNGNLNEELLLSIAFSKVNADSIMKDEDTYIINSKDLSDCYNELFSKEYSNKSFKYNGTKIKYLSSQDIYLADKEISFKEDSIIRYVSDIKEEDNKVIISTIEGTHNEKKLVNIITKKVVGEYKDDKSLEKNADKLNKLEYTFSFQDGVYKLLDINKIN
ncbi:MAG: hypothetical protein ACI31M_00295 [Bacilli bacterium]